MNRVCLVVMLVAALGAGCKKSGTTTTPSTTTGTPIATPTATETYSGVLNVGDSQFFKFTVGVFGTVNVTVQSIAGAGVPTTVQTRVGIGTISDSGCTLLISALSKPGVIGVTANEQPGDFCASIADVGNLIGPAAFTMTVDHP